MGDGRQGQLGNGQSQSASEPLPIAGGFSFSSLSAGTVHGCGVTVARQAVCWGNNTTGQTGRAGGGLEAPAPVAGNLAFVAIDAGSNHTCGLADGGFAYCWGANSNGELGLGSVGPPVRNPASVAAGISFGSLSAGTGFTCGVALDGTGHCWGENSRGQLGDGSTARRSSPSPVAGNHRFSSISAGSFYACGLDLDGNALCWGWNVGGRLGDGSGLDSSEPVPVAGDLRFVQLESAGNHTCGVTSAGEAWCWGVNMGRLGNGDRFNSPIPVRVVSAEG